MEMAVCRVLATAREDPSLSPSSPVKAGHGGEEAVPGLAG